jgi:hypothetical protein
VCGKQTPALFCPPHFEIHRCCLIEFLRSPELIRVRGDFCAQFHYSTRNIQALIIVSCTTHKFLDVALFYSCFSVYKQRLPKIGKPQFRGRWGNRGYVHGHFHYSTRNIQTLVIVSCTTYNFTAWLCSFPAFHCINNDSQKFTHHSVGEGEAIWL